MYEFFEKLTSAFPNSTTQTPPSHFWAFCRYYTRGFEGPLFCLAILSASITIVEVSLVGVMGLLIDWLTIYSPTDL